MPNEGGLRRMGSAGPDLWTSAGESAPVYRGCSNAGEAGCNWVTPHVQGAHYCIACRLNRTIPPLDSGTNRQRWRKIEDAKRRMVYGLLRLGLRFHNRREDPESGLAFDFLSDDESPGSVMTGHLEGVVTLNVKEADDAAREQVRAAMGEPFRTLVGHLRHEVGHYFWDRLIAPGDAHGDVHRYAQTEAFRDCFGDHRVDYGEALERHHRDGAPAGWEADFVSAYASAHPWEDWAETWAHYLHIIDAMETAFAFGLAPQSRERGAGQAPSIDFDPYVEDRFDEVLDALTPVAFAVNSLNRSLGQPDLYPFSISPVVRRKLAFIDDAVRKGKIS